ncbi:acyltransferase [Rhodococcus globerulus]|uniref:acyltransferase family protein n=1 Tax=Rhodococcus globerulus TaxID=33008 RepID=UPI003018F363
MSENKFQPPVHGDSRFAHIDAMRAFAVLVVVLAHAGLGRIVPGGSGVTIFFTISGFVITYIVLRESDSTGSFSASRFYRNRAYKILPPLVIAIIVPTLIWSIWNFLDWTAFLGQILFYYNWVKVSGGADVLPGTGVVWSLSIEEQFYVIFALLWLCLVRTKFRILYLGIAAAICATVSMVLRIVLYVSDAPAERIYYGSDTRLDGLAFGVLLAIGYNSWLKRGGRRTKFINVLGHSATLWSAVVLYILSLIIRDEFFRSTFRYSIQGLAACLVIMYGLVPGEGWSRKAFYSLAKFRPIAIIGLASYSIYLCHLVIGAWLLSILDDFPFVVSFFVAVSVGILVGIGLYKWVEVPVQRIKRNRSAKAPAHAVRN